MPNSQGRWTSGWARSRRHRWLISRFPDLDQMKVLDLGGEPHTWVHSSPRPREVTLLNLPERAEQQQVELRESKLDGWMRAVGGDACDPPAPIRTDRFDLVYSNSVIEHVGGHEPRSGFAKTARSLAEHHWIQTPNRYFPIEPHWYCPGFQFLPPRVAAAVTQVWPLGNYTGRRSSLRQRLGDVLAIELLSSSELRFYFPESEIVRERVLGLTKSLIAVR